MHQSTDDVTDTNKGGRPPEGIKYGQHANELGWDPTGAKSLKQATTFQPHNKKRKSTNVATENADILKKIKKNRSKILFETNKNNDDTGSLLDENNIL
jgi:hypothetical protein